MRPSLAVGLIAAVTAFAAAPGAARSQPVASDSSTVTYRFVAVDGLKIFYREAGPKDAPTILLLHGYPSSSRMFATLIPLLERWPIMLHRIQRRRSSFEKAADGGPKAVDGSLGGLAQERLELGEGVLDRIEVGRVGRQVEEVRARRLDHLPRP